MKGFGEGDEDAVRLQGRKFVRPSWDEAPPPPPVGRPVPGVMDRKPPVRMSEDQKKEMVDLWLKRRDLDKKTLARKYDVHPTTIRNILKRDLGPEFADKRGSLSTTEGRPEEASPSETEV